VYILSLLLCYKSATFFLSDLIALIIFLKCTNWEGTAVAQWLRCCATNRKIAGSIPAGVSGFFIDIKSFRTMALGSTQPLTEMSTSSICWGQRRPVRKADNLPPSCAVVTKSGSLNFLEPSGSVQACNGTASPFYKLGSFSVRNFLHPPVTSNYVYPQSTLF